MIQIVRALDVFLFKVMCPHCRETFLLSSKKEPGHCPDCTHKLPDGFDIEDADSRILATQTEKFKRRRKGIGKKTVLALLSMQDHQCGYCDISLRENAYEIDHVYPVAAGGSNNLSNLVAACQKCNSLASSKVFTSLMAKRLFVLSERSRKA